MGLLDRTTDNTSRKRRPALWRPAGAPEKDESEVRWLMSYSDFMMQLVCLFILLCSVSSIDTSKAVPLAQAWRDEVGIGEVKVESPPKTSNVLLTMADVNAVIRDVQILAGRHPGGAALRVSPTAEGFRLHFIYGMFERGADKPGAQGAAVAELAADLLRPLQSRVASIELVGHASADETDALALSLRRAQETLRAVTRPEFARRLDAASLRAAGRGAHEPAADNAETAGRALNRRVEFVIRLAPRR